MKKPINLKMILIGAAALLLLGCASTPEGPEGEVWPDDERARAHIDLGMSYLRRDKLEFARESFNKALAVNPRSSEAYHGLGLVEAKALNVELALADLKRAVKLDGQNIAAVSDYAVMLCDGGSAAEGVAELERHVSRPEKAGLATLVAFGRCYELNHERDKAVLYYREALKFDPAIPTVLLSMAHLRFEVDNYISTRAFIERYFDTNTTSPDALLLAAQVEDILDNPEKRDDYATLLWSRYPRSEQAAKARELFSR